MTPLKYLTDPVMGCCTTSELIAMSKADKQSMETLKTWAIEEMKSKGIEITEK
jgi:hypothetical protein